MNLKTGAVALLLALSPLTASAFVCSVASTPVSFMNYDVFTNAPTYSTGSLSVSCNNPPQKTMPVTIALSSGNAGSFNPRQLRAVSGSDTLDYYLFTDASRTVIWGDGTAGTSAVTSTVDKLSPVNATIYGVLPARQNVSAGSYGDTIVVTVTW